MINEILIGFGLGVLWVCFMAWIDSRLALKINQKKRFQMWIMATAWETLFFIAGIVIGKYIL